jgi:hypothetical protein
MKVYSLCCTEHHQAPGWSPPPCPDDWNPTINRNKGEPLFEDVDNPGGWSLYTFRPMIEPRVGKHIHHAMPAGAVPVPINAVTGKKIQQETIADLVQPGKIYSLQIETLNWM